MHCYLVLTSNLHLLMIHDSSKRIGNHPLTHTLSSGATFMSSLVYSLKAFKRKDAISRAKDTYSDTVSNISQEKH